MPRPRILVVEDNREIADLFLQYLVKRRYRVAWAHDGVTGMALAKVTRPDLVILNWQMPLMNGLEVLKELRRDPRTKDLKVIFTSGHWPAGEYALAAGAQEFMGSPFVMADLGEGVDRVLAA